MGGCCRRSPPPASSSSSSAEPQRQRTCAARLTLDLDVVYRRTPDNLDRVVACLSELEPYLRGAPLGLPFRWDIDTLRHGLNFTLDTSAGAIDFLGEIAGGGP